MNGHGIKRRAQVGRDLALAGSLASKADLLEAVADLLRLQHPEGVDSATDEWLADRLEEVLGEARERQGRRPGRRWREVRARLQAQRDRDRAALAAYAAARSAGSDKP